MKRSNRNDKIKAIVKAIKGDSQPIQSVSRPLIPPQVVYQKDGVLFDYDTHETTTLKEGVPVIMIMREVIEEQKVKIDFGKLIKYDSFTK